MEDRGCHRFCLSITEEPTNYESVSYKANPYHAGLQLGLIIANHVANFSKRSEINNVQFLPILNMFKETVVSIKIKCLTGI